MAALIERERRPTRPRKTLCRLGESMSRLPTAVQKKYGALSLAINIAD
jgi:hypothetical protein